MKKNVAVPVVIVAALAVTVALFAGRCIGGGAARPRPAAAPSTPAPAAPRAAPAGAPAVQVSLDDDPVGALRLEGLVLDADERPAAGVEVWLSSVPPRSVRTEADGGFSFDRLVGRT